MSISRKIFNYPSEICVQKTIDKFGYHPDLLGKKSSKFIIATCRGCGKDVEVRMGFFNKAGSACHNSCRIEEMKKQKSPFSDPAVREKAKQTNKERYGTEFASQNKDIAKSISEKRLSQESKEKTKKTNLEKYGVENVFQAEEIKEKIKITNLEKYGYTHNSHNSDIKNKKAKTCMEKYGFANPKQSPEIIQKGKETCIEKYGTENPMQNEEVKKKAHNSYCITIKEDSEGYYKLINTLRGEEFWQRMEKADLTLKQLCELFEIDYQSTTARLVSDEFCERYYKTYNFPTQQKQKEVFTFLEQLGIDVVYNTRDIINPLELDVFIPSKNFAIEFNGSYWHSEAILSSKQARNKHLRKTKLCNEKGIRLFHIFERTWETRKPQIINFIKSILGFNSIKVDARKCKIDNIKCNEFLNDNHIQKPTVCLKYFNLTYKDNTVASMTASRHHRQNAQGNPVVLSRLCFKDGVSVRGGSTRLFKGFVEWAREQGYDRIISWSDNSWTDGKIYTVLGFKMVEEYGPDYFYWDSKNNSYLSKQSQKKSLTGCPKEITERKWCADNELYRIYDCGKKKWEFIL